MSNITFKGLKKVDTSSPVSITASNGDIIKAYPSGHSVTPSISVGRTNLSYGDAGGGVPVSIPKSGGGMVTAYPASSLPQPVQNDVSKPIYSSQYSGRVAELLEAISGYKPFSYDMETDPLFKQYRKQYLREGKRATEDTMGSFAGMTGGIPSSYAVTAAAQAGNYYNSQLNDRIPELYQLAYDRYRNDYDKLFDELNMYMTADDIAYGRYRDDVGDFKDDRD